MKKLLLWACALALSQAPCAAAAQVVTVPQVNNAGGAKVPAQGSVLIDSSGAEKGTPGNPVSISQATPTPAGQNLIGNTVKSQVVVSTTTPLSASATYTSATIDLGDVSQPIGFSAMQCGARSDAASATTGFQIFESTDNTNWQYIAGATVSAATFPATAISAINGTIFARYLRVVYINGATPQTIFYLFCRIS
jgi:hypothetical protein